MAPHRINKGTASGPFRATWARPEEKTALTDSRCETCETRSRDRVLPPRHRPDHESRAQGRMFRAQSLDFVTPGPGSVTTMMRRL